MVNIKRREKLLGYLELKIMAIMLVRNSFFVVKINQIHVFILQAVKLTFVAFDGFLASPINLFKGIRRVCQNFSIVAEVVGFEPTQPN